MAPRKGKKETKEEVQVSLGPQVGTFTVFCTLLLILNGVQPYILRQIHQTPLYSFGHFICTFVHYGIQLSL
jgi:hypothetical protein